VTRLVLDTNVVVSALLFRSETARLRELWREGRFRLAVCPAIPDEYARVLTYPKFGLSQGEVAALLGGEILPFCDIHEVSPGPRVCRDPHDDVFLHCAVAARADGLVSGDDDLLSVGSEFRHIPVMSVAEALDWLARPGQKRGRARR